MQSTVKKSRTDTIIALALLLLLICAFFAIDRITEGMRTSLSLCARVLIPTLFPFLVLSDLLLSFPVTQRVLFRLSLPFASAMHLSPRGGCVFLLGNLFGFPMGARIAARYFKEGTLTAKETEKLLICANNASPFFLIGSVGSGLLGSVKAGIFLYLLQFALSFLLGCVLGRKSTTSSPPSQYFQADPPRFSFTQTIQSATTQTLFICGYVLFFSIVGAIFLPMIPSNCLRCLLAGILEISNGTSLAVSLLPRVAAMAFCGFCTSFSGLSVYFQALDCIAQTPVRPKGYLMLKLFLGFASFSLVLLFSLFIDF